MIELENHDIPIAVYWYSCSGSGLVSKGSRIAGGSGTVGHFKEVRDLRFLGGVISYPLAVS